MVFYFKDINKAKTKKATPSNIVSLLIKSSKPLSLRLAKSSELPPCIICPADSALPLCNNTIIINKIDTINNALSIQQEKSRETCLKNLLISQ